MAIKAAAQQTHLINLGKASLKSNTKTKPQSFMRVTSNNSIYIYLEDDLSGKAVQSN